MTLTQILQKIRSAFYTKAETDTKLNTKANDSDVVHKSGDEIVNGTKTFTSEIINTSPHFRHIFGDYGTFWRQDGTNLYLLLTNSGDPYGSWNNFRPLTVNLATGICNINGTAGSVAWANVSSRPTKVSQFTNDSGYITSSGSCNYANSAGSAPANGGTSTASAYLNDYGTLQYGVNRLQYFNTATTTTSGASDVANPTQDWYYHIIQSHANGTGYYFDIASHFHSNSVYYRRIAGGNESGWIKFIDSDNIGSQSVNYANSAGSATNATNATQASYSNQLQAFTGDDFTGGNHFVKAIRSTSGWSTRLWMCYNGGAKTSNEISVAYADSAGVAGYASRSTNNGAFYISGYQIYVG